MIFEIKDLYFEYKKGKPILSDLNLSLKEGEILTILGPNGAGKSTLLSLMIKLLKPCEGEIFLDSENLADLKEKDIAKKVSFVPQSVSPTFSYSVLDYVLMGRAPMISYLSRPSKADIECAKTAISDMEISHLSDKSILEISGGERQLATIARAIVRSPKVILFDEPTSHLDFANQLKVLRIVKGLSERGFSVVITTHNPDHAVLLSDKTALIDRNGNIISGKTEEILTENMLKKVYDTDLILRYIDEIGRFSCLYPNL